MRITALVENKSDCELTPVHGLALYIETEKHRLLFDLGPDDTLLKDRWMRQLSHMDILTTEVRWQLFWRSIVPRRFMSSGGHLRSIFPSRWGL